jgi:hypothetical protein
METVQFLAKDITIASVRFAHDAEQVRFESFPRRLIYKGREYILTEN